MIYWLQEDSNIIDVHINLFRHPIKWFKLLMESRPANITASYVEQQQAYKKFKGETHE